MRVQCPDRGCFHACNIYANTLLFTLGCSGSDCCLYAHSYLWWACAASVDNRTVNHIYGKLVTDLDCNTLAG